MGRVGDKGESLSFKTMNCKFPSVTAAAITVIHVATKLHHRLLCQCHSSNTCTAIYRQILDGGG